MNKLSINVVIMYENCFLQPSRSIQVFF